MRARNRRGLIRGLWIAALAAVAGGAEAPARALPGAPVAVSDVADTAIDTPVDVAVLANDSDPDGDLLSLTDVGAPAHGSATFAGDRVTYTPQPGFDGVDHFVYEVSDDDGHTATAAVSVYVGVTAPPPPVLTVSPDFLQFGTVPLDKTQDLVVTVSNDTAQPVALAEVFAVEQADPGPFDATDFEGCRSPGARVLEPGQSCTQKVRFWAVPGASGASPATARLLDGVTFETLATFALFAATGPPDTGPNQPPVAVDDLVGVAPGFTHLLDALRNDTDPDHDIVRLTAVSDPSHGTASIVSCDDFLRHPAAYCVRYVPEAGYTGIDAFTYTASDGRGGTATATFHLAVGNVVPSVAAVTPAAGPTTGGQAVRITGSGFVHDSSADFVCPSGVQPLAISQLTDTEILATTPPATAGLCAVRVRTRFGQQGQLASAYRYSDAPVAEDAAVSTDDATPVVVTLRATDPNADALTFTIVAAPMHGVLSAITGDQATYTPDGGFHGQDAFSFKASDGVQDSNVATVTIQVVPSVNHPPLASDDGPFTVIEGGTSTVPPPGVLTNDADPEHAALTARFVTAPAHGVLFLRTSGGFDYTPAAGYAGPDSFTYVANDGQADSNVATVSLVVRPRVLVIDVAETVHVTDEVTVRPAEVIEVAETISVSDAVSLKISPQAQNGSATIGEDASGLVPLLATDADGDAFTLVVVNGPEHGTLFPPPGVVMPGGTLVTYTPAPNYFGPDVFTFKARDIQGDSNLATISIVVTPAPDPPGAAPDGPFETADATLTVPPPGVLLNDADLDFEPLTARLITPPQHGTLTLAPDGGFTYVPATGFSGQVTFTYVASDGRFDSNPAPVAIVVHPAPGREVASAIVPAGGMLTTDTEGDGATPEDSIETAVLAPQGGQVIVDEGPAPPPLPTAFTFLPVSVEIAAPAGTPNPPLLLAFLVDGSAVSLAGGTPATLAVFRSGFEVPPCRSGSTAIPDPCVALRQMAGDDVRLVVRTSRASVWTFGVPRSTSGLATGALRPRSGGTVTFAAAKVHGQLVGALTYQKGSERFLALGLSALAVEDGGHAAWFAGLGADGRAFVAHAEDHGGSGDRFRLWIGGVLKTGDGGLASGNVLVLP
jgi:hypothetical protein